MTIEIHILDSYLDRIVRATSHRHIDILRQHIAELRPWERPNKETLGIIAACARVRREQIGDQRDGDG